LGSEKVGQGGAGIRVEFGVQSGFGWKGTRCSKQGRIGALKGFGGEVVESRVHI
jgi:hypothetical protein